MYLPQLSPYALKMGNVGVRILMVIEGRRHGYDADRLSDWRGEPAWCLCWPTNLNGYGQTLSRRCASGKAATG